MIIRDHMLVKEGPHDWHLSHDLDSDVKRDRLPGPPLVVIHYAITRLAEQTRNVLLKQDYLSAHVTCDHDGTVIQMVPFNKVAYHAGVSSYKGKQSCNAFSIGIEISNPGPLVKRGNEFHSLSLGRWYGDVIAAPFAGYQFWAAYSETEISICEEICKLVKDTYGILDIVGHSDIAPRRKIDPGPAFPMNRIRRILE